MCLLVLHLAIGTAVLALLLAGYLAQKYLPPPPPKIVGIDLGKLLKLFTSTFENKLLGVNRDLHGYKVGYQDVN